MNVDVIGSAAGRAVESAAGSAHSKQLKELKKACEQFEAVFAKQILGEMRKGIKETQIGNDQSGSAIYKDMMDQAIADSIGHQGGLGIGKMLYKQFEKQVSASLERDLAKAATNAYPATPRGARQEGGIEDADEQPHRTGGAGVSPDPKQAFSDLEVQATVSKPPLEGPISMRGRAPSK